MVRRRRPDNGQTEAGARSHVDLLLLCGIAVAQAMFDRGDVTAEHLVRCRLCLDMKHTVGSVRVAAGQRLQGRLDYVIATVPRGVAPDLASGVLQIEDVSHALMTVVEAKRDDPNELQDGVSQAFAQAIWGVQTWYARPLRTNPKLTAHAVGARLSRSFAARTPAGSFSPRRPIKPAST